jgi:molybdate transport system substrate-binding protein
MKRVITVFTILFVIMTVSAQKVNVAAAANLRYVLEELKTAYISQNPKAKVNLTFGASGMLVQQIQNGASFDLFMAADNEFPLKLKEKGLTTGNMSTYAFGKLAIYSTSLDLEKLGLAALKDPTVKKIAIANPATAPYGERAEELLKSLKLYESLKPKIITGENISQTAQFAFTGNAEIGFIALSLALAPEMAGKGNYYIIPQNWYKPIEQACILIKTQVVNTEASKFKKFILSAATKAIWEKWGYSVPGK